MALKTCTYKAAQPTFLSMMADYVTEIQDTHLKVKSRKSLKVQQKGM